VFHTHFTFCKATRQPFRSTYGDMRADERHDPTRLVVNRLIMSINILSSHFINVSIKRRLYGNTSK